MNVLARAQYTTLLTPDMASSNVLASETSPTYACTLSGKISRSLSLRTSALTEYPRRRSLRTRTRPTRPAAPTTRTVVNLAFGVSYSVRSSPARRSAE